MPTLMLGDILPNYLKKFEHNKKELNIKEEFLMGLSEIIFHINQVFEK